jgi:hypothetical protein
VNADEHGAAPAAECVSHAGETRIEAIILGLDPTASYARSAAEAAWRGEIDALETGLRRLRVQGVSVVANFKRLDARHQVW